MLDKASQSANNGHHNNQAGRDNVINNYYFDQYMDIEFYEDDIKDIILMFSDSIVNYSDSPPLDLKAIKIDEKNEINNLSDEYNKFIVDKSLSYFGKIKDFLYNPANLNYLEMYNSTIFELNQLIIVTRERFDKFDEIFLKFSNYILKKQRDDKLLMKNRTKVLIFLHFMYYNCDIGKKAD